MWPWQFMSRNANPKDLEVLDPYPYIKNTYLHLGSYTSVKDLSAPLGEIFSPSNRTSSSLK
jgi:hypothetical protein